MKSGGFEMFKKTKSETFEKINHRPLTVGSIVWGKKILKMVQKANKNGADIIELRCDTFPFRNKEKLFEIVETVCKKTSLPIIATLRSPKEQGRQALKPHWNDEERKEIYEKLLPIVDFIDIELSSNSIHQALIQKAHKLQKKVILSYHDFRSMPEEKDILLLVKKFKQLSGDIFKIAGMTRNLEETIPFLYTCSRLNSIDRVFIAMGEKGNFSRIAGFCFGSCLTYGSISQKTAPGQIPIARFTRQLKMLYSF